MLSHGVADDALADGLRTTLDEIAAQPYDEKFHAKLLQVIDLHLAAKAYLC